MDYQKRPLVIDLSGKAGAGKTYIKDKLIQHLSSEYKCVDLSDYIFSVKDFFYFFLEKPLPFLLSIVFVFLFIPKGYGYLSADLRRWTKIQIKIMRGKGMDCDFIFIDEGLFRRLSLIRIHSFRRILFEDVPLIFRKNFLYPDITIFVSTDYDLCEERRMERDKGTRRFKLPTPKEKGIKIVEDLKRDIEFAESKGIVRVLYYNNVGEFNFSLVNDIKNLKENG